MERRELIGFIVLTVLLPAGATTIQAQQQTVEICPFGAHWTGDRTSTFSVLGFESRHREADGSAYGVWLGYNASPLLALEVEAARVNSAEVIEYPDRFAPTIRFAEHVDYLLGHATLHLAHGSLRPYVTFGAGARRDEVFSWRFTAGAGAGLKVFLNPNIAIRIDGRVLATSLPKDVQGTDTFLDNREWTVNGQFGGGLLVAF